MNSKRTSLTVVSLLLSSMLGGASFAESLELEKDELKLGFIKLTDMAPLAIAYELGFFEDEGLYVTIEPQANWKVLLDRVITGELDYRCPYTQSLAYFTALQKREVPSRLIVYPEAGHWPSWREMAFYYNAHLDWFHRFLGGEPAPYDVETFARNRAFQKPDEAQKPEEKKPEVQ